MCCLDSKQLIFRASKSVWSRRRLRSLKTQLPIENIAGIRVSSLVFCASLDFASFLTSSSASFGVHGVLVRLPGEFVKRLDGLLGHGLPRLHGVGRKVVGSATRSCVLSRPDREPLETAKRIVRARHARDPDNSIKSRWSVDWKARIVNVDLNSDENKRSRFALSTAT